MNFENQKNQPEREQNPELRQEVEQLDQKAEQVAQEIEELEPQEYTQVKLEWAHSKLEMVIGALVMAGGIGAAALGEHSLSSLSSSDLENVYKVVSDGLIATVGGAATAYGLAKLIKAYINFNGALKKGWNLANEKINRREGIEEKENGSRE